MIEQALNLIHTVLDMGKAEDIVVMDLREKTEIAEYMVIASGCSSRHVVALVKSLSETIKKNLSIIPSIEGLASSEWVVLDIDTIVVHVFLPDLRGLYNLEELWSCTPSPSVQ